MAGANYFLYRAIGQMNAALADLIQFTAPVFVVVWMAITRQESLDRPKLFGMALSIVGCGFALGVTGIKEVPPTSGIVSALLSAVCFATTMILGKRMTGNLPVITNLHFALMFATIFWLFITPPWVLAGRIQSSGHFGILVLFSITSILLPYLFFFAGLSRVSASRAGIVSTFEPVVVALASWVFLSEPLAKVQILGVFLVCSAIIIVEATSAKPIKNQI